MAFGRMAYMVYLDKYELHHNPPRSWFLAYEADNDAESDLPLATENAAYDEEGSAPLSVSLLDSFL